MRLFLFIKNTTSLYFLLHKSNLWQDSNAVMKLLNGREDSVLRGRIKVFDGRLPKGAPATFVNNAKMIKLFKPQVK